MAVLGVVLTTAAAIAPGRIQQREASGNVERVTSGLAVQVTSAIDRERQDLQALAATITELTFEPASELTLPGRAARGPADSGDPTDAGAREVDVFRTVTLVGPVSPDADADPLVAGGPALAHRYRHDGGRLVAERMSVGPKIGSAVRAMGLPIVPEASTPGRVVLIDLARLPDPDLLGRLDALTGSAAAAPQAWILAVPVTGVGWLMAPMEPAALLAIAAAVPGSPALTVSFHAGVSSAGPLLAQARATMPPPAAEVRWRSHTAAAGGSQVTVVVGADRRFATTAVVDPVVIVGVGLGVTALVTIVIGGRAQRRYRLAFEQQLAAARLAARTDTLTGLRNRLALDEALDEASERLRGGDGVAVLLGDLDRFKVINDARGHDVGDLVLAEVANRISRVADPRDLVARFGGDEFVVVLAGDRVDHAVDLADAIVASLRRPFTVGADAVVIGVSMGLATAVGPTEVSRSSLLRDADLAMYVAKRNGGNRVAVAGDDVRAGGHQLDLEIAIRAALGTEGIRAWYQPLVDGDRQITALEALVRWDHPERGLLSPGVFLPAAKDAGLLGELSTAVLSKACDDVARWNRARAASGLSPLVVHVNTVEEQLLDAGFADVVGAYLQASGLDPSCLLLEISEETALDRLPATVPTLELIRSMGVRFSIDDFGFGNSSLTMVRRVGEVAELKIDKSIVDSLAPGVVDGGADIAVIAAITEFARAQMITVVAEGIEHEEQFHALRTLGVELFQGYLFHRPQPAERLDAQLGAREPLAVVAVRA